MAEPLKCGTCGAELTNEALARGACTYCNTALKLPPRPGKDKQARVISTANDELVVRVDEGDGIEIQRLEGIVMGDPEQLGPGAAPQTAKAQKSGSALPIVMVVLLILVLGSIGFLTAR